jgi:CO/xanthine dehydrogenase FAD-binding subunit
MIHDFIYLRADTVKEVLDLLEQYKDNCKIICGGQSLLILMRQGLVTPEYLIDIKGVEELNYIHFDPKAGLKIGATTTHRVIEKSSVLKDNFPVLVDMEKNLASIQTRNWGTIGGNLAHGDPAGCPAPVLIALSASVKMANKERERSMSMEDFTLDYFETALEDGELLLEIQIPVLSPKTAAVYEKFNIIKNDMAIVSVAASITLDGDSASCKDARIVLGGAASTPFRAKEAEKLVIGEKLDDDLIYQVGEKASEEAEPIDDIHATEAYRRHLVMVLTKKMVKRAWEQAKTLA